MSKYIVSVFDNETAAYAGARALGQLDDEGSIAVYEAAILAKERSHACRTHWILSIASDAAAEEASVSDITIVLGNKNYSSWSLRGWLPLAQCGIPFDEIVIPLRQPDTARQIAAHSPSGKVPALKAGKLCICLVYLGGGRGRGGTGHSREQ